MRGSEREDECGDCPIARRRGLRAWPIDAADPQLESLSELDERQRRAVCVYVCGYVTNDDDDNVGSGGDGCITHDCLYLTSARASVSFALHLEKERESERRTPGLISMYM